MKYVFMGMLLSSTLATGCQGKSEPFDPLVHEALITNSMEKQDWSSTKLLLSQADKLTPEDRKLLNDSLLCLATERNNMEIVQMLLDQGANINDTNEKWVTPLAIALQNNHLKMAKLLVQRGGQMLILYGITIEHPSLLWQNTINWRWSMH